MCLTKSELYHWLISVKGGINQNLRSDFGTLHEVHIENLVNKIFEDIL